MDDAQVGSVFRAVRIRRGLSQEQVAVASGVCRSVVSLIERGGLEDTSVRSVRRVAVALGVSLTLVPRWRGADLAELLDERHAAMVRGVVARLTARGWQTLPERTFSVWGERGAIDVLAWHAAEKALLCVEVKTRLPDLQDLLSTMDRKRRLAPGLVRELGWRPIAVGSVLALPAETWARHVVARFAPVFAAALPMRAGEVQRWLRQPERDLRGIWFMLNDVSGGTKHGSGGSMRVRPRRSAREGQPSRSDPADPAGESRPRLSRQAAGPA
jgi:transcriptional regulator with XRE-family HTH domain